MQSALNVSKVNQSLESVRLLASRPAALLDPFALLAALEQLSDHAREANHSQCKKFFKQCRPLANSNSLAEVVLKLFGDKKERDVASQIRTIFKGHSSPRSSAPGQAFDYWGDNFGAPRPGPYPGSSFGRGGRLTHSTTGPEPFLGAFLFAEVIFLGIAH